MFAGNGLMRNLRVHRCAAGLGGAIYLDSPAEEIPPCLILQESSLSELGAGLLGGAVFVSGGATAIIEVHTSSVLPSHPLPAILQM